jgi:hypothetical protein
VKLSKDQRATLRGMFDGRCAYCGCALGDRWHADHVEAVERVLNYVQGKGLVPTGALHRPENDCIENLVPACAPCNIDKHVMSLEDWRKKLARALDVLERNQPTFRHAMRFGLLELKPAPIVFHFERLAAQPAPAPGAGESK